MVRALHEDRPLRVVVVEDVHWADEATLDMLRFLGRRIRPRPPQRLGCGNDVGHRLGRTFATNEPRNGQMGSPC